MITLRGKRAGKAFERNIKVDLPANSNANQALAQLWARKKIDEVMAADWTGIQNGNPASAVKDKVTQLGLDYRLMTQFTSFVAVEEQTVVEGGQSRTIQVPVEMPQGVSPEGVFGADSLQAVAKSRAYNSYMLAPANAPGIVGGASTTVEVTDEAPQINTSMATITVKRERRDEKVKDVDLSTKLHRDLLESYNCWKAKHGNCAGVKDGKVRVEVWLDRSLAKDEMEQLFSAGLKPDQDKSILFATSAMNLRGTIDLDKLPKLAKLATVRLVSLAK
jgi:hypothetical protein